MQALERRAFEHGATPESLMDEAGPNRARSPLAGRGLPLYAVAKLGAWLCGRASEIAISHDSDSEESLSPTSMIRHLGLAFRDLDARRF